MFLRTKNVRLIKKKKKIVTLIKRIFFSVSGQNDIKKLRRENEQLRRDIWLLRDKYTKLEDVLKNEKNYKIDVSEEMGN